MRNFSNFLKMWVVLGSVIHIQEQNVISHLIYIHLVSNLIIASIIFKLPILSVDSKSSLTHRYNIIYLQLGQNIIVVKQKFMNIFEVLQKNIIFMKKPSLKLKLFMQNGKNKNKNGFLNGEIQIIIKKLALIIMMFCK